MRIAEVSWSEDDMIARSATAGAGADLDEGNCATFEIIIRIIS